MRDVLRRIRRTIAGVVAAILSTACGPHHTCSIAGTPMLLDGGARLDCEFELYIGDREDRLFSQRIWSGQRFEILVSVPIVEPGLEHHALVRCPGYQAKVSKVFQLGAGWGRCTPVELGTIQVGRQGTTDGR